MFLKGNLRGLLILFALLTMRIVMMESTPIYSLMGNTFSMLENTAPALLVDFATSTWQHVPTISSASTPPSISALMRSRPSNPCKTFVSCPLSDKTGLVERIIFSPLSRVNSKPMRWPYTLENCVTLVRVAR